jgi:hypothetical protein
MSWCGAVLVLLLAQMLNKIKRARFVNAVPTRTRTRTNARAFLGSGLLKFCPPFASYVRGVAVIAKINLFIFPFIGRGVVHFGMYSLAYHCCMHELNSRAICVGICCRLSGTGSGFLRALQS